MKSTADKSSSKSSGTATRASNTPFIAPAARSGFIAPSLQMKLEVSKPGDRLEQEADSMAGKVMRMAAPPMASPAGTERLQRQSDEKVRKAPAPEEKIQRKSGDSSPAAPSGVQSAIQGNTGGQPLSSDVRGFMEPRFNADFSNVRVHDDQQSASLGSQLSARAFTYQNHIFFSRGQFQPGSGEGKQLLAHELTHTIQQGHAVQRTPEVSTTSAQPQLQRSASGEILDWIADKARNIPGFTMFTVVLGMNPINMSTVDRSAANILEAMVEFMPGGRMVTQALENHGIIGKVATWVEGQIRTLGMVGSMFKNALTRFIDSLGVSDLAPWNWGSVWNRAQSIFTTPVNQLISFAGGLVRDILRFIREAVLKPLAALAQGTRGYDLLRALLGEDPVTGEAVPRTPETLIGGFMKLIGQEEIWENIKKGNAIARAWAWFQGALSGLLGFARSIPRRIVATLASLTITDLLTVAGAFSKIVSAFAGIAGEFLNWALDQVINLLEILFSVVAPGVMPYIKKAQATFTTILKDPIGFVGNLVRAGKLGFQRFASKIGEHLKTALIKWLVGPLAEAGVYIPKAFSLPEIVKLVLSVLGLTWQNIRGKLVKIIPEPVLVGLEKTAGVLVTLVKDGPAAAWEQIKTELGELKDQLVSQITQMVSVEVVKAAVMKLVSMINPAGAVIQAIIAIYNTVTFFIDKINQIAAVVASFIDSVSAIASGQVDAAAAKVEQTLANTLTVVISFLAKFAGLGGIPNKIVGIVKKIRQPIDRGLDKIVAWLAVMLKKLGGMLSGKSDKASSDVRDTAGDVLAQKLGNEATPEETERSAQGVTSQLSAQGLKRIFIGPENADGDREIFAEASPPKRIRILARKKITVGVQATVTVTGEPALSGLTGSKFSKFDKQRAEAMGGTGEAALLPEVTQPPKTSARKGSQPSSGLVIKPEAGSQQIEVVSWNTKAPEKGHNVSHAERQFINWFDSQAPRWKQRVASADVVVYGRDICELCAADLQSMRSRYSKVKFSWKRGDSDGKAGKGEKREVKP
ncbi:MAG TPA: DUF4157 domain-containing protein [Chlorobaculum sp.]|nr:DUF4157 domain-containing protein [Chlorobaculum sp.]